MADQNTSVSTANLNSQAEPEEENPLSVFSPFFKQSFFFLSHTTIILIILIPDETKKMRPKT